MISTDNGLIGVPLAERKGINLPTPANLQRVTDEAAAKRQRETETRNCNPQDLGRAWGVTRDMAQFISRLEARVIELENEVARLRSTSALPPHMRTVEVRG
jgi:hypothetical protein